MVYIHPSLHNANSLVSPWGKLKQKKHGKVWLLRWKPVHVKSEMTYLCNMSFLNLFAHIRREQIFLMLFHHKLDRRNHGNETNIVLWFKGLSDSLRPIWRRVIFSLSDLAGTSANLIRLMQLLLCESISRTETTSKSRLCCTVYGTE